jgi:hypothetical protein
VSINQITYTVASGQKPLHSRPFPWFNQYILAQPVPVAGPPTTWCPYGPGTLSSIYVNLPDGPYTLNLDTICQPNNLAQDADYEAIPYPLSDAVPFISAYLAAMTMGLDDKAERMWKEYRKFVALGDEGGIPAVLPSNFDGKMGDIFTQNRLAIQPQSRGQS